MLTNSDLEAFSTSTNIRSTNGGTNDSRERLIIAILNRDEQNLIELRRKKHSRQTLDRLVHALQRALYELQEKDPDVAGMTLASAHHRGGRTNNHDIDLLFTGERGDFRLAVEVKRGSSIYDQPQFLSLYVNTKDVLLPGIPNYAEYFYDNYFTRLQQITQCAFTTRSDYLSNVFGTSYTQLPFNQLYAFVKSTKDARRAMASLQHESIDQYLKHLSQSEDFGISLEKLQSRMYSQLPKRFLSWDPAAQRFIWERFTREGLTLISHFSLLKKATGQFTTIVMETMSGQNLCMLLRWKNNPCVKGPAWQIKLSEGN